MSHMSYAPPGLGIDCVHHRFHSQPGYFILSCREFSTCASPSVQTLLRRWMTTPCRLRTTIVPCHCYIWWSVKCPIMFRLLDYRKNKWTAMQVTDMIAIYAMSQRCREHVLSQDTVHADRQSCLEIEFVRQAAKPQTAPQTTFFVLWRGLETHSLLLGIDPVVCPPV